MTEEPRPFYKPLPLGARIFWTAVTLAGVTLCVTSYAAILAR